MESHIHLYKSQEHLDELPVVDLAVPVAVRGADHLVHLLITQVLAQVHQHLPGDTNLRTEYLLSRASNKGPHGGLLMVESAY